MLMPQKQVGQINNSVNKYYDERQHTELKAKILTVGKIETVVQKSKRPLRSPFFSSTLAQTLTVDGIGGYSLGYHH